MEKDALLEIIIHDLKEVEMLAQNVKGSTPLSKAFFKLTRNRINSILEEIEMLEELSLPTPPVSDPEAITKVPKTSAVQNAAPKHESKPDDLTPPGTLIHQEAPVKNQPVGEPLPEKEIADTAEEKEEKENPHITEEKEVQATLKQASEKKEEKEPAVLGEKFNKEKSSFNEQIGKNKKPANSKRSYSAPPVTDLKKAMGINDRFFFQRELFGGNAELMHQTLEQLNQMQGITEAQNFLLANFNWDPENEALLSFMELVERRYL